MFHHLIWKRYVLDALDKENIHSFLPVPSYILRSLGRALAGPRGQPTWNRRWYRLIQEISLPLPGLLNKINEEILCNCLVNSQSHTYLSMNYQICLGVILMCDFNIASDISLSAKIWAELFIFYFFLLQIFIEHYVSCSRNQEIKSTAVHSIFLPAK
jgi:hypothetical protein